MIVTDELNNDMFRNDEALQEISRDLIAMDRDDVFRNNQILKQVIEDIFIPRLIKCDEIFKDVFITVKYGGSYYKGLKVGEPDEYDLNLLIKLPIDYDHLKIETNDSKPGYVKIKVDEGYINRNERLWREILDGNYVSQDKFNQWMQSLVDRTLSKFKSIQVESSTGYYVKSRKKEYIMTYSKSGPAFNISVSSMWEDDREINFDLVPVLEFTNKKLRGFRKPASKEWIAIAKPLKPYEVHSWYLFWRVGFYNDEKRLLKGQLKPIIKLMKTFRDAQGWTHIKSYFIETLFLNELSNQNFMQNYPSASRTNIFIYMLERLQQQLERGQLFNYWHQRHNLFEYINMIQLQNTARQLRRILDTIDDNIESDPDILLDYFFE